MDEEYTIGADTLHDLGTWVDASFAIHPDMRSHTGGMISYGLGGIACKTTKQKSTMRSSTHAEMVGVSDYLPTTIWVTHFMTAQGYPPKSILWSKTTRVLSNWKSMDAPLQVLNLDILTSAIFGSRRTWKISTLRSDTAVHYRCSLISLRSHYRAHSFAFFVISFSARTESFPLTPSLTFLSRSMLKFSKTDEERTSRKRTKASLMQMDLF
jgi:hypothetical protein